MTLIIIAHTHSQYLAFLRAKFPKIAHSLRGRLDFQHVDPLDPPNSLATVERGTMVYCVSEPAPRVQQIIRERFNEILFVEQPSE